MCINIYIYIYAHIYEHKFRCKCLPMSYANIFIDIYIYICKNIHKFVYISIYDVLRSERGGPETNATWQLQLRRHLSQIHCFSFL